jgi:DNA (cytosine-5)-methyltransferase 1
MRNNTLKILDLFSGAGGFSLGFELVKDSRGQKAFHTIVAVDNDKFACQSFRKNFPETEMIEGDITKISVQNKIIKKCKNKVDIIIGGPPCQSFSTIGPRSGYGVNDTRFQKDKRDRLYLDFVKIVKEVRPRFIVIENVMGILSKKDGRKTPFVKKIVKSLEKIGYSFKIEGRNEEYQILNSVNFGVPQRRKRVLIIGNRIGLKNSIINPTHYDPEHEQPVKELKKCITLKEAIGDLPRLKAKITMTGIKKEDIEKIEKLNESINSGMDEADYHIKTIAENSNFLHFVSSGVLTGKAPDVLRDHVARSQQITDIQLFGIMKPGETAKDFINNGYTENEKKLIKYNMSSFYDKYRKQKWNGPATTLFAHLEKDGNRFIHPDSKQARTLTVREAARIQSFPDDFIFEGPYNKKFRQIGNAVPPLVAYNIGICLVKMM